MTYDHRRLADLVNRFPKRVSYTYAVERVRKAMGGDPYNSPSHSVIYHALLEAGYATDGKGEYQRRTYGP